MSFDTVAPFYRAMELVLAGGLLQRCRTTFLAQARHARRVLLLGEGPGRFLQVLLRANPDAQFVCVESSGGMIAKAERFLPETDRRRVAFEKADAVSWEPPEDSFDLIASHFFLDCFRADQLDRLISSVGRAATSDARWLLTDFCVPPAGWRRQRARLNLSLMFAFFRIATRISASRITPPDSFLEKAGFQLKERSFRNFGFIHCDLWMRRAVLST